MPPAREQRGNNAASDMDTSVYQVKYAQDYEAVGNDWVNNTKYTRLCGNNNGKKIPQLTNADSSIVYAVTLAEKAEFITKDSNTYLYWTGTTNKNRYIDTLESLGTSITTGTSYAVSFDVMLENVSYLLLLDTAAEGTTKTIGTLGDEQSKDALLYIALSGETATLWSSEAATENTFAVAKSAWYRFTISGKAGEENMTVKVIKIEDGSTVLDTTSYKTTSTTGIPWIIQAEGTTATMALDNIVVYSN